MGDGGDCEMRGVGMHGSATGTAEPGEPGGAAQAVGGMRERGGVQEAQDARDAREVPLDARVEECPATDELRASFRSAINRILAQSHGIYDVALRSSPSQSHAEAQRGEEMGALLHQIIDKWVQYSQVRLRTLVLVFTTVVARTCTHARTHAHPPHVRYPLSHAPCSLSLVLLNLSVPCHMARGMQEEFEEILEEQQVCSTLPLPVLFPPLPSPPIPSLPFQPIVSPPLSAFFPTPPPPS
ncbi:unnamed protein product [Closterium sp. NIES-53]